MPPKQAKAANRGRGAANKSAASRTSQNRTSSGSSRPAATGKNGRQAREGGIVEIASDSGEGDDVEEEEEEEVLQTDDDDEEAEESDEEPPKTIPSELLKALLHEFFEDEGTRITRDANQAVAKYMDVFVREAIARSAVERGGFLEVEDLEKISPQLLLDL
ncbi:CENP-S associating centromere protein X-domain-containing protein [Lasiosphaeria hispida]|uniref:CENP-S associating centromere protein X-domain-containing protein n=1 Tax=Lasiosphaeria hispida TaxID=260671 RepID=A0AAJ0H8D2_9PEZI|nr:CENP-S associating centromere protein X-domain-containing protein [Lasiosphaeria hispida]